MPYWGMTETLRRVFAYKSSKSDSMIFAATKDKVAEFPSEGGEQWLPLDWLPDLPIHGEGVRDAFLAALDVNGWCIRRGP